MVVWNMVRNCWGGLKPPPHSGQVMPCASSAFWIWSRLIFSVSTQLCLAYSSSRWSARKRLLHSTHSTMGSLKWFTCPDASKTLPGVITDDSISRMPSLVTKSSRSLASMFCFRRAPSGP